MKFAMQDSRTLKLLENATTTTWKLVAFFFHDRGSEVQRSLDGMMQEILHSILQQYPSLLSVITPLYLELVKSQRAKVPKWDTLTLQTALLRIAQVRNPGVRLCLFLDALDEHGGDNEKLAVLLKDMVNSTDSGTVNIKVCLASRPWSVFTKHFGNCPGFAIHEHTLQDISSYTTSRLTPDSLGSQHLLNASQLAMIAAQITEKSSGVFIWVRLVIDQLSKEIQDGTPFGELEDRVMEMPPELEDLYRHTLRRIDVAYSDEAYMMLQIAYCGISPLPLQTFVECASYNQAYSESSGPVKNRRLRYAGVTEGTSLDTQLRRLASRSGGLLEAISNTRPLGSDGARGGSMDWPQQGYHVQFIHQTAKEFVAKHRHSLGLSQLSSHVQRRNGAYFLLSPNAAWYDDTPPWLYPLSSNLFIYAKRVEASIDPSDHENYCSTLHNAALDLKVSAVASCLANASQPLRQHIQDLSSEVGENAPYPIRFFSILAVAANLILYISTPQIGSRPGYLTGNPDATLMLHVAVGGSDLVQSESVDDCAMIETLVKIGCPIDSFVAPSREASLLAVPHSSIVSDSYSLTPLAYLLISKDSSNRSEERRLQIAKTLLKLGADVNAQIQIGRAPHCEGISILEYCVRYDTAPFVRLLLQHGALELSTSKYSLGDFAFLRGDKDMIQVLQDHGLPLRPFASGEPSDLGTVPEALVNISYYLPLILPHGEALPEDVNKVGRRLRTTKPHG